MTRSVNQVQDIIFPFIFVFHLNRVTLNCNPTFALQVHVVKQLRFLFTSGYRLCSTKKSVGKRTFSVVNVCNNAKISNIFHSRFLSIYVVPSRNFRMSRFGRFPSGRAVRYIFCSASLHKRMPLPSLTQIPIIEI